jgi:cell division protein FtsB
MTFVWFLWQVSSQRLKLEAAEDENNKMKKRVRELEIQVHSA